jgi:hypothetical protein
MSARSPENSSPPKSKRATGRPLPTSSTTLFPEAVENTLSIDGKRQDQGVDGRRESFQTKIEGRGTRHANCATRRLGLVEEGHVSLVGEFAGRIEPKTGQIKRQSSTFDVKPEAEIPVWKPKVCETQPFTAR